MDFKINDSITKYCGNDWLSQLETITGNIHNIDEDVFNNVMSKIYKCNNNVHILLKRVYTKTPTEALKHILNEFNESLTTLSFNDDLYIRKLDKKKIRKLRSKGKIQLDDTNSKLVINTKYYPENLIKHTKWFEIVKKIEREVYHCMDKIFVSVDDETHVDKTNNIRRNIYKEYTFEKYNALIKDKPDYVERYKCFDVSLNDGVVFNSFINVHKYTSITLNLLLTPLYDINSKIDKSFDKKLSHIFKPEMMRTNNLTREIVVNLLTDFMVAKYRSTLTGNDKHFMNMLINNISEGALASMSAPRFIEIMDTINTDVINDTNPSMSKALLFTRKAKDIVKRIAEHDDKFDKALLDDVVMLMKDTPTEETTPILNDVLKEFNK